jgi:hypothetical protein
MKLIIMHSSPTSVYFIPLGSKYSPQHLALKYLNVGEQASHPYKTTGKIIVLYILMFMFLESRWEELNWTVASVTRTVCSLFPHDSNFDLLLSSPNIWIFPYFQRTY